MNSNTLAVIFPGQASQKVGMLKDLSLHYSIVKKIFFEASEELGYDLWRLIQYGPVSELNKTYKAQPAILTASVAVWKIWSQIGGCMPSIMAGHSLGEYTALVCSESIELRSAVKLVEMRGALMQELVPYGKGAMSVIIGLHDEIICELCNEVEKTGQVVSPAGFNAPGYVVISGDKEAVDSVNNLCKNAGAKHVFILPISVPSHCALMKPMIHKFSNILKNIVINPPTIPVINNTDVRIVWDPDIIRESLIRQLYTPVRWYEIIRYCMDKKKISHFVEIGPGNILTKLLKNLVSNVLSISVNSMCSLKKSIKLIVDM
ncbi:ACP S-malonyltransferase [Candidatus Blochmannia ocreatus (nom. nud.)]|uniref:Malonyl CoA-acyl carrier protein transacylase n=1 Tax=Candidatus Blochmannia ocreatus (nom. nud.) TaxID=251538 RepID=A0ABY4SVD9_9ENTR|nr:ACP S-malonyltransferase [Candidatus Blochmannia ocreatus]URJ24910.1 ACP S-malonyltransferase [Candidatus Blochmannia ocreatus]